LVVVESLRIPELPASTVRQRAHALRRVIEEQAAQAAGPASAASVQLGDVVPRTLRQGAASSHSNEPGSAAEQFLALLECTYLVAAADSITAEELGGLCTMIEVVTGAELSPAELQAYFREFRAGLLEQGRAGRVRAIASTLGDFVARQEALHLAVLFAVADGTLARKETRILIEVAEAFGHSIAELQVVLDEVGSLLGEALAR
jgi:tellurite resistance protein